MSNATTKQAIETAAALQRQGRPADAERVYRQLLGKTPDQPDALHGLGLLLYHSGSTGPAMELIQRAVARKPTDGEFRNSLGVMQSMTQGPAAAVESFERAVSLRPSNAGSLLNLGNTYVALGRFEDAMLIARRAMQADPRSPDAHALMSSALMNAGRFDEAMLACQTGLTVAPNHAESLSNLGNLFSMRGQIPEAIEAYRRAIASTPNDAKLYSNLANALEQRGQIAEAYDAIQIAVRLDPNQAPAQNNFGNVLKDLARLDEAMAAYRRAIALAPQRTLFHSNLVYAMWFRPQCDPLEVLAESRNWARQLADPITRSSPPHQNDRTPDRKIRIGYVSSDFRQHPVGRLIYPLLACRDRSQFDLILFSGVPRPDPVSQAMYQSADRVYSINGVPDDQLADLVRREKIDILVDLTLHMASSRLLAFAQKPAPVQITYLAYCATSGMAAMDYCVTDPQLDPPDQLPPRHGDDPGVASPAHSEKLLHLNGCYWCYTAPAEAPPPSVLPASRNGFITFASLNSFTKQNTGVMELWCRLLQTVPDARLSLVVPGGPSRRNDVYQFFDQRGITAERLKMSDIVSVPAYFNLYLDADVALDPFPYNGGTTTMDALYMGLPVVTLAGRWATARAGVTILETLGCPQWVTQSAEQYVQVAADLAQDLPRLSQYRSQLRQQMLTSRLMDARQFTHEFETRLRATWKHWCAGAST